MDDELLPLPEDGDDLELEREFQQWAQWLLDVYLWKLEHEHTHGRNPDIDSTAPSPTM